MRKQATTAPDLTGMALAAQEREQRSPRLVILGLTLLLVGIAVGVLWTQGDKPPPPAAAQPR